MTETGGGQGGGATAATVSGGGGSFPSDDSAAHLRFVGADCAATTTATTEDDDSDSDASSSSRTPAAPAKLSHTHKKKQQHQPHITTTTTTFADGPTKLIVAEEKESGHVPFSIYRCYIEAGGSWKPVVAVILLFLGNICIYDLMSVWLSLWSTGSFGLSQSGYLLVYISLGAALLALHPVRNLVLFAFLRRANGRLHEALLYSLASAKVGFFDQTPLGRIVNRFSKDMYVLDDGMAMSLILLLELVNFTFGVLVLTVVSSPLVIVLIAAGAAVFYRLFTYYSTIIREIRRRGSIAQSPMYSLLEEVTSGRESIDAYGKAHVIFHQGLLRLDKMYSARYVERVVTVAGHTHRVYLRWRHARRGPHWTRGEDSE